MATNVPENSTATAPSSSTVTFNLNRALPLRANSSLNLDITTASVAVGLGAKYRLRTIESIHLATAVVAGADRFLTNNRRDFPKSIEEVDVTYPEDLG